MFYNERHLSKFKAAIKDPADEEWKTDESRVITRVGEPRKMEETGSREHAGLAFAKRKGSPSCHSGFRRRRTKRGV